LKKKNLFLIIKDYKLNQNTALSNFHNISFDTSYYSYISKKLLFIFKNNSKKNPIKLIILDLDNTIWGGLLGEIGATNIIIGKSKPDEILYREFQIFLKKLKNSGILLAICSKNFVEDVNEVFSKNKNMILKKKDFVSIKANWDNKVKNIKLILNELNVSETNTLFVDDSKFEREVVKKNIKNIKIFDFPSNKQNLVQKFKNLKLIKINNITNTDLQRSNLYLKENKRSKLRNIQNYNTWLKSLNIKLNFEKKINIERISEMFFRTNQFNNCLNRYNINDLQIYLNKTSIEYYQITYEDVFGYDGIISFISLKNTGTDLIIENFLLSCRYFERQIEDEILRFIVKKNIKNKKKIKIRYKETKKNKYFVKKMSEKNNLDRRKNFFLLM
jgi:FkbH-like protein